MKQRQILIVEDDPEDRAIIKDAMDAVNSGETICFAENGEEALVILGNCARVNLLPCLIVLDLNMPRMSGTETLRIIKSSEEYKNIPVVIYSTSVNKVEKERCFSLGAEDYITKPLSFTESKLTAQRLIELSRQKPPSQIT